MAVAVCAHRSPVAIHVNLRHLPKKAVQEKEQRLRDQYQSWWRKEVTRLQEAAPDGEIAALEEAETAKLIEEHQNPFSFPLLVRVGTDARLAER